MKKSEGEVVCSLAWDQGGTSEEEEGTRARSYLERHNAGYAEAGSAAFLRQVA